LMTAAGGGSIVNMASVSAFIGANDGAAYHTTKGAVLSLSRALAQELAPAGIRVNSLCPGWVDTPFTTAYLDAQPDPAAARAKAEGMHALNRMARPEDVAAATAFLLSPAAGFITGTELIVDGGFMIRR
jgi:NAD(P)-dependent dehydrogenase (short-subunit alcohol dehydrogenase family)